MKDRGWEEFLHRTLWTFAVNGPFFPPRPYPQYTVYDDTSLPCRQGPRPGPRPPRAPRHRPHGGCPGAPWGPDPSRPVPRGCLVCVFFEIILRGSLQRGGGNTSPNHNSVQLWFDCFAMKPNVRPPERAVGPRGPCPRPAAWRSASRPRSFSSRPRGAVGRGVGEGIILSTRICRFEYSGFLLAVPC